MSPLVTPPDAVAALRRSLEKKWAEALCAEFAFRVRLRPGVENGKDVERLGYAAWHGWHMQWRDLSSRLPDGVEVVRKPLTIRGVAGEFPVELRAGLDGAVALCGAEPPGVDVGRVRTQASVLRSAGAVVTPATLKTIAKLSAGDVQVLINAVTWLGEHPDAGDWTLRQLPVPGMHTKWLDTHGSLLRDVTGRDVRDEVRPRLTVIHLTYVDPGHVASGRRRHDAWTTGDVHDIAYRPRVVLVVENRDSRLWFPPVGETIVVEGGGKAAAALLANVPWIRSAEHVVYWGDIDADGYAILDRFRAALAADGKQVASILMEATDLHRYAVHGVSHDKAGHPLKPSRELLPHLSEGETIAYNTIATAGPTPFRRIEQEVIPLTDAVTRLLQVVGQP
ncbi:hypothetical protein GCM10010168_49900 [Actinoplanes ianthinogenes]|uniref:Wadjet protein JetD C-terminal domain-containing protein n=1 Tax=Actinoplanes ianthinogenes TaxID=122358 RepID=A0ABM7M312_9ACTN|nr:Wadjet anti-phage system protein JetD domain-containing protein [Actinoplanes ianthinogenes]BCJ46042.1 hypothetical protein Aiant_66990 [Actinoplanes ianthinogenes]GGR25837.1 hypothetical protein GCM10010168_49900 [Actinoplanes ianthinogenes]